MGGTQKRLVRIGHRSVLDVRPDDFDDHWIVGSASGTGDQFRGYDAACKHCLELIPDALSFNTLIECREERLAQQLVGDTKLEISASLLNV